MAPSETRLLSLSRDEVIAVTDRVRNEDAGTEDQRVTGYRLLLKLASAYIEVTETSWVSTIATVPVAVTEAEAWLLRARVSSADKLASDALFGVKLLRKLYRLLLDFNDDADVGILPGEVEGEAMTDDRRAALKRRFGGKP